MWALYNTKANCEGDNGTQTSSVEVRINDEQNQDSFVGNSQPAAPN